MHADVTLSLSNVRAQPVEKCRLHIWLLRRSCALLNSWLRIGNTATVVIGEKIYTSLGGLEPPTFRLTAERANRLRHRDVVGAAASSPRGRLSV